MANLIQLHNGMSYQVKVRRVVMTQVDFLLHSIINMNLKYKSHQCFLLLLHIKVSE